MKAKVLLDLDGVIANFYYGFANFLNDRFGCTLDPTVEPNKYPFEQWGQGTENVDWEKAGIDWARGNGFATLPAYDGATKFVNELCDMCDVYMVTARIGDWDQRFTEAEKNKIKKGTLTWLKDHGMPADRLYFAHDKIPFCQERGISIMIEDKLETALKAAKEGMHTILINRGYNGSKANRVKVYRVYQLDEALNQLRKLLNAKKAI